MNRFMALEKKYQMISISIIIVLITSTGYLTGSAVKDHVTVNKSATELIITDNDKVDKDKEKDMLVVNIKGAVKNPGIYEFPEYSRVNDALQKAVPLENADLLPLNLAMFLKDEQDIYVPYIEDLEEGEDESKKDSLISINKASTTELEMVPGIGPVMAGNIVEYRKGIGRFQALEDLLNVTGIGEKTLDKMRPYIKL